MNNKDEKWIIRYTKDGKEVEAIYDNEIAAMGIQNDLQAIGISSQLFFERWVKLKEPTRWLPGKR